VLALARAGLPAQQGAARFPALRVFHLDDLGTEPGERLGAGWAGLELGQVQNTDAGKKGRKPAVCSHFLVLPSVASVVPDVDVVNINPVPSAFGQIKRIACSDDSTRISHVSPARSILSNALNLRRSAIAAFVRSP